MPQQRATVACLLASSIATSTAASYRSVISKWMPFASSLGAPHFGNAHRDPRIVPAILEFLAFLVRTGSASTPRCLGQPLAALRHHFVSAGFPDPTLQRDFPLVRRPPPAPPEPSHPLPAGQTPSRPSF